MVRIARSLLAFACDAGAPALASFLLPTASAGCASAAQLVAALEGRGERRRGSQCSLLHRALRSNCPEMVEGLVAWGAQTGYQWQVICLILHMTVGHVPQRCDC